MGNSFTRDHEGRSPRRHLGRTCNEQQTGPASQAWTLVCKHSPSPAPEGQVFLGSPCPSSWSQGILGPDHGGVRRKMPMTARCTSARGPDAHTCQSGACLSWTGLGLRICACQSPCRSKSLLLPKSSFRCVSLGPREAFF